MKRSLLLVMIMCFAISSSSMLVYSDETAEEKPAKADETKEKDAKKYDLTPKFKKDMTWTEKIKYEYKFTHADGDHASYDTYKMDVSANSKVIDLKGKLPKTIKYTNIKGKTSRKSGSIGERTSGGGNSESIKDVKAEVKLNEHAEVASLDDIESTLADDYKDAFAIGPIFGFHIPEKAVSVGQTWSSKEMCSSKDQFDDEKFEYKESSGKFELVKVEKDVAFIKWTGTATYFHDKSKTDFKFEWESKIKFDIKNQRSIKISASTKIFAELGDESLTFEHKVQRELDYGDKKDEKEKIAPKDDE